MYLSVFWLQIRFKPVSHVPHFYYHIFAPILNSVYNLRNAFAVFLQQRIKKFHPF